MNMEHYSKSSIGKYDANSAVLGELYPCMTEQEQEYLLQCLARWMLSHWTDKRERQASLERIGRKHGAEFVEDLKRRMMSEHNLR